MCKLWVRTVPTFWKRKFLGVRWVVASKLRLLLEFCWVSSGGKNIVQNLLFWGWLCLNYRCSWIVVISLWLVVGVCGRWHWNNGWLWVVGVKLLLVMSGGGEIKSGRGWPWVVRAKLRLGVDGSCWSWVFARFSNAWNK